MKASDCRRFRCFMHCFLVFISGNMDDGFHRSLYSSQFNILKILGAWPIDDPSARKQKYYLCYSIFMLVLAIVFVYMGIIDFIDVLNDFRKISWNMCVNLVVILTLVKNVCSYRRAEEINTLRRNLYRKVVTCKTNKQMKAYRNNRKEFRKCMIIFYYPYGVFYPFWACDSLYRLVKGNEYPLPQKWIWELSDGTGTMVFMYLVHIAFAGVFLFHAITTDLATFGIMYQIYREYEFLHCDIDEFKNFVQSIEETNENTLVPDSTKIQKKKKIKLRLRELIKRQRDVIRFTEDFEYIYNFMMLVQIFVGGGLILMNCVQILTLSLEFDLKMTPQGAYVFVIILDGFMMCFLGDRITDKCREVGDAVYDIPWYAMDIDLRKDVLLVILRSQKPPKITSGKLLNLSLEMYSETLKNIYRWMAVFRQFGFS